MPGLTQTFLNNRGADRVLVDDKNSEVVIGHGYIHAAAQQIWQWMCLENVRKILLL
jgi:hypothetical protein